MIAWYNSNWQFRVKITVKPDYIDSDLTNHPLLLTETNFPDHFWNNVKSDGSDIVVTGVDGVSKLKRELVSINTGTKKMELWVRTGLSSNENTVLYLYYKYPGATETNDTEVWDSYFEVVYHLNEDPSGGSGCIKDSTVNGRDGTPGGTMLTEDLVDAKIGKGLDFDGGDDNITIDNYFGVGGATLRTIELWLKADSAETGFRPLICWGAAVAGQKWALRMDNYNKYGDEILRPNGVGYHNDWGQQPASGFNWDKVDEEESDGDSTYVYATASPLEDTYNIPTHSEGSGTINSVTVKCRARKVSYNSGSPSLYCMLRTYDTDYVGSAETPTESYAVYSKTWTQNPNTSAPWTWDEIDAMEIGCKAIGAGQVSLRVTQVWAEVNYGPDTKKVARTEVEAGYKKGTIEIQDDAWHHLVQSLPGSDVTSVNHFIDTILDSEGGSTSQTVNTNTATNEVEIASAAYTANFYKGIIDEVRISSIKRSNAYLKASYYNVEEIDNFYSVDLDIRDIGDYLISDDWVLLYYDSDHWVDITNSVIEITSIKYSVDNRVQGSVLLANVVLDESATYGTDKYVLGIGDNYFFLGAPYDGIVPLANYRVSITLVDYLLFRLDGKAPLTIYGEGDAVGLGGGKISVKSIKDFLTSYRTVQHDIDIDGFSSHDKEHYTDGLGNAIHIEDNTRYESKGVIYAKDQETHLGKVFVRIENILDNIISGEGFTSNINYGYDDENNINDSASLTAVKKIWDVKMIRGFIFVLYSEVGNLVLSSYETNGTHIQTSRWWTSRDWDESSSGVDNIGYQMYPDHWNNRIYIPTWRCVAYNPGAGSNTYLLRVTKLIVGSGGAFSISYQDDYSAVELWGRGFDPTYRSDFRDRDERFTRFPLEASDMHMYIDENVQRLIIGQLSINKKVHVIDPDRHDAGPLSYWKHTYDSEYPLNWFVPDDDNGSVFCITWDGSNYIREIFRVDMPELTSGYAVQAHGGSVVDEDDPLNHSGDYPVCCWRESIYYDDEGGSKHYYHVPQLPNGVMYKEAIKNKYIRVNVTYMETPCADINYAGSFWDRKNDIAIYWKTDIDTDPSTVYWFIYENYVYRRMYLYQQYLYKDEKQQFIDAIVGFGFFYEQVNGEIRPFRIRGTGTSLGTLTDILFHKEFKGFSRFAEEFSMRVSNRRIPYGDGDRKKDIDTIIGEYGWVSPSQVNHYTDWVDRINGSREGIKIDMDLEAFKTITGTYLPDLGKTFIYDLVTYILIEAELDIENKIIHLTGVKDV